MTLGAGLEGEVQLAGAAGEFAAGQGHALVVDDCLYLEVAERRDVQHDVRLFARGQAHQALDEFIVGRVGNHLHRPERRREGRGDRAKADHAVARLGEALGQKRAEFPR